jgi:Flp pilus assembly protein TadG
VKRPIKAMLQKSLRNDAGSMTVFAMFIFVIILMVGGIAVDVMRYEMQRVHLQNTADRAVLAAGSLRQPNDPEEVVRDYFRREGLEGNLVDVQVVEGLNFRTVNVQTSSVVPTLFMRLLGVPELRATPVSASEERYSKVEVALVLDLSNSMNSFNRIDNLRDAGADFVDTLFENAEPDQVSLSIIPYTGQVNLGPVFSQYFNISPRLTQSQCVDFNPNVYNTTAIQPGASFAGTGHFDPWHTTSTPQMFFCPTHTGARGEVVVMSGDQDFLRNRVSNLMADGNTSIEIGVKWGAALLDPAIRPVISDMIVNGHVSSDFAGRPLNYDDPDVLKVMVIMTDGENFEQWMMRDNFKTGWAPIVRNTNDGRLSIYHSDRSGSNKWYIPHNNTWQNRAWGSSSSNSLGPNIQLQWDEVWTAHTVRWVARNLYRNPLGWNNSQETTWINSVLYRRTAADKNTDLAAICAAVRARDIPIFTVAFEAPPVGVSSMQMCATSASHFFDVEGTDIRGAFRAIAGTINRLRLTQ